MQFTRGGPDIPESLLQAHEDGHVVFFCGAGISYPAGLPGFEGLVKQLYSRLNIDPNSVQEAAIKAKRYDTAIGLLEQKLVGSRQTVRQNLAEILNPDTSNAKATATHQALLTLSKSREQRTRLITTNFDRLFEHIIASTPISVNCYQAPLLPVPKNRWDGLVYLHGLLPGEPASKTLDDLVVSSGDFGRAYLTERWAARFVSELLRNFNVCFVGYSIDDPVLRYMMDALAADRLLGESPKEMFAFGSYSRDKETAQANEWKAKNVVPILYREYKNHAYLHKTLQAWANTYRDGARGKERVVVEHALAHPDTSTKRDDFVGRMLWALSDPSGLPAKRFADLNPVPSLDWLGPLGENRFGYADLIRFGVPPKTSEDNDVAFSLTRRPTPYDLSLQMALANSGAREGGHDDVMHHLTRWLTRHLNDPALLLWLINQGGRPHPNLANQIARRMDELSKLQHSREHEELDRIRSNAPNAVPGLRMRTLWNLLLAGRVKPVGQDLNIYRWPGRCEREGLTTTLRLELREMLTPRVSLRARFPWPYDDEDTDEPAYIRRLVDWNIVLSTSFVHRALHRLKGNDNWNEALPALLTDFTALLRDALDLMRELGGADDRNDLSYLNQPSISEHPQNHALRDWTALIELNRDAWRATAIQSKEQARLVADAWSQLPYPLFRRLAFFAAAQDDVVPHGQAIEWLLADDYRWLWSTETLRETMRLLVALGPQLNKVKLRGLERAILAGPPREMYRADIEKEHWIRIQERAIWLRLAKISHAGAKLNAPARKRLESLCAKYPDWQLAEDERDEFSSWTSDNSELGVQVTSPRGQNELIEWLRDNPDSDTWQPDDWYDRCRDDFDEAALALTALANEGTWPTGRWREALQRWSEDELTERSWCKMASVLAGAPNATLQKLSHEGSRWLEKLAKTFTGREEVFLSLCDRMLALDYEIEEDEDPVSRAINHPVGNVTWALIHWWYRNDLEDEQGLTNEPRLRFTQICDTGTPKFRHGRVLLAAHLISLFRVDRNWTMQYMLPLFKWDNSELEARSAWEGFLWTARLYRPLMEALKPSFLDTANHCALLGRHSEQYASLLTFVGLDVGDIFQKSELALATQRLPQQELEHASETLFRAVDSAGNRRADYWKNRAAPYLESIWPKTPDLASKTVSENLGLACVAAGDAFGKALKQVRPWLKPLQYPDRIAYNLHEAELDTSLPEPALDLLNRIFGDNARGHFPELGCCLDAIRTAQPKLGSDHRFQRLLDILRANGGDLRGNPN